MRKILKKILFTSFVGILAVMTGCSSGFSDKSGDGSTTNIHLYRATYNIGQTDERELGLVQDAINDKLQKKGSKVSVTIKEIPNEEYADAVNIALSKQEADLFWTASWWNTIGTNDLYQQKLVYDLTGLLKNTALYKSMPEWYWEAAQYNGRDYFVPVYKEGAEGYDIKALKVNADKYGLELEHLFDEKAELADNLRKLEPYLKKAKADGIRYPYLGRSTGMFQRFGMDYYDFFEQPLMAMIGINLKTNEVENPIQSKEFADYCKVLGNWGEKGYLNVDEEIGKTSSELVCQTQNWLVSWWTDIPNNAESFGRDGNQEETFGHLTQNYINSHTATGSCFAVSAACDEEKAKACIEFLGYLYTDVEIGNLFTYGIEGTDYVLKNGKVDRTAESGLKNPGTLYNHSPWESTSIEAVNLLSDEPDDKLARYKSFNEAAVISPASGFRFDHSSVDAQYNALISLYDQYGFLLDTGGVPEKDVDAAIKKYQEAMDEAGYQEVFNAAKEQYDKWKKQKK